MKDFTKFGLPNPPGNHDQAWQWLFDSNYIMLEKLSKLDINQKELEKIKIWGRITLGICTFIAGVLSLVLMWIRTIQL